MKEVRYSDSYFLWWFARTSAIPSRGAEESAIWWLDWFPLDLLCTTKSQQGRFEIFYSKTNDYFIPTYRFSTLQEYMQRRNPNTLSLLWQDRRNLLQWLILPPISEFIFCRWSLRSNSTGTPFGPSFSLVGLWWYSPLHRHVRQLLNCTTPPKIISSNMSAKRLWNSTFTPRTCQVATIKSRPHERWTSLFPRTIYPRNFKVLRN